ncbi:hypothetical protein NQ315_012194 [Exocentrus adspersus]|uniref:Uncharacterized protein n=1 Tax=Exocentrus adspersus TaxID=1586481 RepID=A0AAV8VZ90_9CUCU|nr:hypothetical protein NQ315_012194 [Exocentrus adspersus]
MARMFINIFKDKLATDSSRMSSYLNLFLKTEVTCIPKLLRSYMGEYYNNALCNGATWMFILWCVLHIAFDKLIDAFLKKLRYREYVRIRLKK